MSRTAATMMVLALAAASGSAAVAAATAAAASPQRTRAPHDEPFHVDVYPSVAKAPAIVRLAATVEPSRNNAAVIFTVDSGTYFRSSTIELSDASARVHAVEFRALPAGAYDVTVALTDVRGDVRAVLTHQVRIVE